MDTLKSILQNRYKIISLLSASMVLSIILLMIRIKLTQNFMVEKKLLSQSGEKFKKKEFRLNKLRILLGLE